MSGPLSGGYHEERFEEIISLTHFPRKVYGDASKSYGEHFENSRCLDHRI